MKVKTIKKIITKKLEEWLKSIEDTRLRAEVRENLVLSGGSITSLFLGEDVNDYDIYIQDINVCETLARYYGKQFAIEILNGDRKEEYMGELVPDEAYESSSEFGNVSAHAISIKSLRPGQIKLNINGAGYAPKFAKTELMYNHEKNPYHSVFFSQNAISLSDDIQIVTRFTGSIEEIHKSFDFIHATNYFTFEKGLVTNIEALQSIMTKELLYQGSQYPLTSVIRMKKFIARHWTMNAGQVLKMLFQVAELDLMNPVVLEEQLVGVDIAYFSQLIERIRKEAPDNITPTYISKLIDEIFNGLDEV